MKNFYVPTVYLPAATDFTDMVKKEQPTTAHADWTSECPRCHGYGGWNLRLNAYPRQTPDPTRPGFGAGSKPDHQHFQASCAQCWGWGWVKLDGLDATCIHTYEAITPDRPWRCWHTDRCTKCGRTVSYSSDD